MTALQSSQRNAAEICRRSGHERQWQQSRDREISGRGSAEGDEQRDSHHRTALTDNTANKKKINKRKKDVSASVCGTGLKTEFFSKDEAASAQRCSELVCCDAAALAAQLFTSRLNALCSLPPFSSAALESISAHFSAVSSDRSSRHSSAEQFPPHPLSLVARDESSRCEAASSGPRLSQAQTVASESGIRNERHDAASDAESNGSVDLSSETAT